MFIFHLFLILLKIEKVEKQSCQSLFIQALGQGCLSGFRRRQQDPNLYIQLEKKLTAKIMLRQKTMVWYHP